MYKCAIRGTDNLNMYEELIKVFLEPGEYEISDGADSGTSGVRVYDFCGDKDSLKREIYGDLKNLTGKAPQWGILTGIRPVKLAGEIAGKFEKQGLSWDESLAKASEHLRENYYLSEKKAACVSGILDFQRRTTGVPPKDSLSAYVGIPFCPTRCLYCSFTSNQVKESEWDRYLDALCREIRYAGAKVRESGQTLESLYIGGGTPTTFDEGRLARLLDCIASSFDTSGLKEYTVEAGRPDTITAGKLQLIRQAGADRISINPQTMKDETLELIGRKHTVEDILRAFETARECGIEIINMDLIAGLPGESMEDFVNTLNRVIGLGPENITVHTLAVKRASRLKESDERINYRNEDLVSKMIEAGDELLEKAGYRPYYLYRQKHTSGNTENKGFCRNGTVSPYNIRIMEEAQSILALGAGGISKIFFPEENRLERVANVSNYSIYIDRIDEMIQRKENGFFIR